MPTAEPFTALGRGNGFPFCLNRVQVADEFFPFFSTLSGVSHENYNSLSDEEIEEKVEESFIKAMNLFWNWDNTKNFSANFSGSIRRRTSRFHSGDPDPVLYDSTVSGRPNEESSLIVPGNRVCFPNVPIGNPYVDVDGIGIANNRIEFQAPRISALFFGDKFLGYGGAGGISPSGFMSQTSLVYHRISDTPSFPSFGANVYLRDISISNIQTRFVSNSLFNSAIEHQVIEIDGMHFLLSIETFIQKYPSRDPENFNVIENSISSEITPTGYSISRREHWIYTGEPQRVGLQPGFFYDENISASFDLSTSSFSFYTYP